MNGLVQPSTEVIADKEVLMMPGVISTRSPTVNVRVINFGESEVTLHPKQSIGSCESYYELPQSHSETKAAELRIIHKVSSELTKTLEDMVNKASPEMTASEKEQWKDLVWRFRGIFATSKADLGKTRLVRHKINTGNAVPIRIPARRLPLGKRKTEHEEVKSMLERGVIQPSTSPWASPIAIDILGPLPRTRQGNRFVLVISDYFTKYAEAVALPDFEAETVAKAVVEQFICRFGTPRQLHSDRATNFESKVFQNVCKLLNIHKTWTTSRNPRSDGMVERFNRTLATMLTMYCESKQNAWDQHLPYVMLAYRSSVHDSTGFSPNMMMLGREVELPLQAVVGSPQGEPWETTEDYVRNGSKMLTVRPEGTSSGVPSINKGRMNIEMLPNASLTWVMLSGITIVH